ncbi:MAG: hypothetical protein AAFV74_23710 [Pseudomonadota bacterium]
MLLPAIDLHWFSDIVPVPLFQCIQCPRKEGGKGLLSIKDTVYTEIRALGQYLKTSEDQWLAKAWEENLIKEDEDPETYKDRIRQKRKEDWRRKVMHGQFTRQTEDISSNDSFSV